MSRTFTLEDEMGAWGAGPFDNDDAMDWLSTLMEAGDGSPIEEAFEAVPAGSDFLDSPEASTALAAAEVVAAALGTPGPGLPAEAVAWAQAHAGVATAALASKARQAVDRVVADSELRQLWEESESFDEWQRVVADLQRRLGSAV